MKRLASLLLVSAIGSLLPGCGGGGSPADFGSYNPLRAPGAANLHDDAGNFRPGQFARTLLDNAAFFKDRPSGSANADRLLKANTPFKVIESDGTYLKVELDSGDVGYIPAVLATAQAAPAAEPTPAPAAVTPPQTPAIPTTITPDAPPTEHQPLPPGNTR